MVPSARSDSSPAGRGPGRDSWDHTIVPRLMATSADLTCDGVRSATGVGHAWPDGLALLVPPSDGGYACTGLSA